jgi:ankyrin repeat protein
VNAADIDGTTPLIHAALYADADVVGLLIDRGADVNLPTKDGMTALMAAAGDLDKVRLLLERGAKIAATTKSGRTPLLIAATYPGNVEVVRLLLKNGALATEQDSVKETPLTSASKRGDVAMAEVLIAAGAKLNAGGRPPLVWAAEEGSAEMVACLLKHGAGKVPKIVNAALFSAVVRGPLDSVRMLLEAGADVNAASGFAGYTPLMGAAYSEVARPELIALLLEKRADATARTEAGVTSLALARKRGHTKIVDLLTKAGATE